MLFRQQVIGPGMRAFLCFDIQLQSVARIDLTIVKERRLLFSRKLPGFKLKFNPLVQLVRIPDTYRVFHRFGLAKFADVGSISSSSQLTQLPQLPQTQRSILKGQN